MTETSMYARVMGAGFDRLAPELRQFHRLAGRHTLHGRVTVSAPGTRLARVMGRIAGTPQGEGDSPLRFDLLATPAEETWTRHFTDRSMTSRMQQVGGCVVEHLGPARFSFELVEDDGRLVMRLVGLRVLGIPCPRWLMPRVTATEHGRDGALHFDVVAEAPVAGLVAAYRGHIVLAPGASAGGTIEG